MPTHPEETKLENMKVKSLAKGKVDLVVEAIKSKHGVKPTLTEALVIMADHYLATAA